MPKNAKTVKISTSLKKVKKVLSLKNLKTDSNKNLGLINYLNLINNSYPPRIFKNFLKILIINPHIILEENENLDILKKKKYRSVSNKKFSEKNNVKKLNVLKNEKIDIFLKKKIIINLKKNMIEKNFGLENKKFEEKNLKVKNLKVKKVELDFFKKNHDEKNFTEIKNEKLFISEKNIIKKKFPENSFSNGKNFENEKNIFFECIKTRSSTLDEIPDNLTKKEIENLIKQKMAKLENFNKSLDDKKTLKLKKKFSIKKKEILKIIKIQKKFKSYLIKKKFFQTIYMNKLLIHQNNSIMLKKSLKEYEKFLRDSNRHIFRGRSISGSFSQF